MTNQSNDTAADKGTIRSRLLSARRACAPGVRSAWSEAACKRVLSDVLRAQDVRAVAAYASFGTEPDTGPLLAGLLDHGVRVLLPTVLDDNDLAWGWYSGPDSLVRGNQGKGPFLEPAEVDGLSLILDADLVILPGLAVDAAGNRLGRGGGSYDRVLARIVALESGRRPRTVVMLYPPEVGVDVPVEPHDLPVDGAVTAEGTTRFR